MFDLYFIAHSFIAFSWIILLLATVPQFYLNMKLKAGTGISDEMLLGQYNLYVTGLCFIYGTNMPLLYKIMSPLSIAMFFLLIFQRLYYNFAQNGHIFLTLFLINTALFIFLYPFTVWYPYQLGLFCGWVSFGMQFVYQLPQIAKIVNTKTVHGFSFGFMLLTTVAYCFEFIAAIILKMPYVVYANDLRAILIFFIFCFLFWYYPNKRYNV
jgi:hypothetical protein